VDGAIFISRTLALTERNDMLQGGEELYTRLSLGLQSLHGPSSDRLHEFGLKPKKARRRPVTSPVLPEPANPPEAGSSAGTVPNPTVK
jgi:hypothetical protein